MHALGEGLTSSLGLDVICGETDGLRQWALILSAGTEKKESRTFSYCGEGLLHRVLM